MLTFLFALYVVFQNCFQNCNVQSIHLVLTCLIIFDTKTSFKLIDYEQYF